MAVVMVWCLSPSDLLQYLETHTGPERLLPSLVCNLLKRDLTWEVNRLVDKQYFQDDVQEEACGMGHLYI